MFFCLVLGGGGIVINLPAISDLPANAQIAFEVADSITTITLNTPDMFSNGAQTHTRPAGPPVGGNRNAAIGYANTGNIWAGF